MTEADHRRATIGDVARSAGVSRATVSRVLNGRSTVDAALVARVEATIAALEYRPSETARNLSLGRTNTVALVVPDLGNPMFQAILRGATRAAAEDGFQVLVADTQERPEVEKRAAIDARRRCDALLLCAPRMNDDDLAEVLRQARPLTIVNRAVDDAVPQVAMDYRHAIRLVADHLAGLGHRRILYLGGPITSASNQLRLRGIDDAEREHPGMVIERREVGSSLDAGWEVTDDVLESGATAVIAYNDLVAIGLLSRLDDLGVAVPGRLSVVGVDDIPFARFSRPHLTTVSVPQDELGTAAWAQLRGALAGEAPGEAVWVQGRLVERHSTGPAA
ncbi:LacI family DNA-binding transcriptional regulator [Planococcus sp. APC 4015]|nr:LacI family DNA-binding transcriptional regulator [Planococcus sp. APC 4015]